MVEEDNLLPASLLKNLFDVSRNHHKRFLKAFVMVLFSNCLLILNPLLLRYAIHQHATAANYWLYLTEWIAILLVIALTAACFKYWMRVEFTTISRDVEKEVRSLLFEKIQRQTNVFFDKHDVGELVSRLSSDISAYRDLLGPGVMYPMSFLTLVGPGICALFYISPILATVSTIPLLTIPLLNWFVRKPVYVLSKKVQELLAEMSTMVQEHYSGIRIVKSYAVENPLQVIFGTVCECFSAVNIRLLTISGLIFPFFNLLTKLVTTSLVCFAGIILLKGWELLNPADFVSFMWIQSYIFFPILMLAWVMPMYQRGRASYDRLRELYLEPISIHDAGDPALDLPKPAEIYFKDLSFTYPNAHTPSLKKFTATIPAGALVGIAGPVGAGKSTLFALLNRAYEVPNGKIFIGDNEIHSYTLEKLQQDIVNVEQNPFLFSKSIRENVKFGKLTATEIEMETATEMADVHETIQGFKEGYDTLVGERGVTLSGGQKQRLAIARALLVSRSILLLDDIFSAVDAATEKRIFESLRSHMVGKTVLMITHRISVLDKTDYVLYMENGSIVEQGAPSELLQANGKYAALAELQKMVGER